MTKKYSTADFDRALASIVNMTPEKAEKLAVKFERRDNLKGDEDALKLGIERLTTYDRNGDQILIVKPFDMLPMFQVNLYDKGGFNIDRETAYEITLTDILGDAFRFAISAPGFNYFVDLESLGELEKVSKFLDVKIGSPGDKV